MPDRKDKRAEAERDTDATELEPDLQYGVMRMEREGLVRQGNAIRPIGLVAVVDDDRRRAAGTAPSRCSADALWSPTQHVASAPSGRGNISGKATTANPKTPNSIQRNRGSSQTATRTSRLAASAVLADRLDVSSMAA